MQKLEVNGHHHHDMTVFPGGIAYLATQDSDGCDHIFTANADGSHSESLIDLWEVLQYFPEHDDAAPCHANSLRYSAQGDYFTASDRGKDVIVKISSDGEVLASIGQSPVGGTPPGRHYRAEGATTRWRRQHGHHLYAEDELIVFSNGEGDTSRALHYTLSGNSATLDWEYTEMGRSGTLGDAFMTASGTSVVVASNTGVMDEVAQSSERIKRLRCSSFGYAGHRPTLYGAPPL